MPSLTPCHRGDDRSPPSARRSTGKFTPNPLSFGVPPVTRVGSDTYIQTPRVRGGRALTDPTKRFVFWGVMVLLVIAPLIGLEVFLRVVGLGNPVLYYRNTSFRYAPVPNQRVTRRRGATVTIDSYGLRGVRDWAEPADVKLLFIGNSVTWSGTYIDDRQTFPHLTCVHLRAQLGRDFTCGNAGVNAYGTDNMAERLRYKRFNDEDVIVVTIVPGDATRGLADVRSFLLLQRAAADALQSDLGSVNVPARSSDSLDASPRWAEPRR